MNRKTSLVTAAALALTLIPAIVSAQNPDTKTDTKAAEAKPAETHASRTYEPPPPYADLVTKTYYLSNTYQQNDANEILIALRNMLQPWVKIYLVASQDAIVISTSPDQQALAQKIIDALDRPQKVYRLTYTLNESDAGKRIGVQHFAITVVSGQPTMLKEGSKIPVVTGTFEPSSASQQNQFQYLDIGMNFDVTLDAFPNGLRLRSKVEQSSLADEHASGPVSQDPIVRQTVLEGTSLLTPGKPLTLGSIDIPGSTRHVDIEVIAEPLS